jgi:hypothetical protein
MSVFYIAGGLLVTGLLAYAAFKVVQWIYRRVKR